jgi:hypothetical protein
MCMLLLFSFSMCRHHPLLMLSCKNMGVALLMVIVVWFHKNKKTIMNMVLALVLAQHGANVGIYYFSVCNLFLYYFVCVKCRFN